MVESWQAWRARLRRSVAEAGLTAPQQGAVTDWLTVSAIASWLLVPLVLLVGTAFWSAPLAGRPRLAAVLLVWLSLLMVGHGTLGAVFGVLVGPVWLPGLWRGPLARLGGGLLVGGGLGLLSLALWLVVR